MDNLIRLQLNQDNVRKLRKPWLVILILFINIGKHSALNVYIALFTSGYVRVFASVLYLHQIMNKQA